MILSYFTTDLNQIYSNKITKLMLLLLLVVMIADPFSVYVQYGQKLEFIESIGQNGFQFWLLMNSRSWGFSIYHSLFMMLPVLSTALLFYDEKKSSMYELLITRKSKRKFYLSKIISTFFATFVNFFVLFSINIVVTNIFFPFNAPTTEHFIHYIPKTNIFSYPFFNYSPISMVFLFVFLNAFTIALLSLIALSFQMIIKIKNKYVAILGSFVSLYLISYLMSILLVNTDLDSYNFKMIIQPMTGAVKTNPITGSNVLIAYLGLSITGLLLLVAGYMRNRDSL